MYTFESKNESISFPYLRRIKWNEENVDNLKIEYEMCPI